MNAFSNEKLKELIINVKATNGRRKPTYLFTNYQIRAMNGELTEEEITEAHKRAEEIRIKEEILKEEFNSTHQNYRLVKNQSRTKCPHCGKYTFTDLDEEKYFDCDYCGSNGKYLEQEIVENTCKNCKYSHRSYFSYFVDKCNFDCRNDEDMNEYKYDDIDHHYICDNWKSK